MSSRYWCFTLNNPSSDDAIIIECLRHQPTVQFLFAALETGASGTLHYQGYLEMNHHKQLRTIKNLLPLACHLEARKGTAKQALTYCLKDVLPEVLEGLKTLNYEDSTTTSPDTQPLPPIIMINTATQTLSGILSNSKSKRLKKDERLLILKDAIDSGKSNKELTEIDFPMWLQYQKHLDAYRVLISPPRDHSVDVVIIQGPSGTGKSRYAKEHYPDAYWKQRSQWWDNYTGQDTVVIDEFYGWLPYDLLLRLCDRYPMLVETKGGQTNFTATTIVFTTNQLPDRWYKNVYFAAFIRRVSKWIVMPTWGETTVTEDYQEAVRHMIDNEIR